MTRVSTIRRRLALLAAVGASTSLAGVVGADLAGYGVSMPLVVACSLSCLVSYTDLAFRLAGASSRTTHRCPRSGCDFRVRLENADAGEIRRWQEIAATHPHRIV